MDEHDNPKSDEKKDVHEAKSKENTNTQAEPLYKKDENESKPNGRLRPLIIFLLLALIGGSFLWGYIPRRNHTDQLDKEAKEQTLPGVTILQVKPEEKIIEITLPSSTQAYWITPIWARTDGYLNKLLVDIGDHVKEGQLLAELDTPEVDQQYYQSQADLNSPIAKLEIAKITYKRWQDLFNEHPEAVPQQEVDERRTTLESAAADLVSSEANTKRLKKLMDFKFIYAPFTGIITQRNVDLGALVTAGSNGSPQQLFQIAETDIIRAFVNVPQYYYRHIQNGLSADVLISEFPDKPFKGIVTRNAKALDPVARTLLTEVHIDNKDGTLLAGLFANVKFSFKPDSVSFTIPTDAIIIRTGAPLVALLEDGDVIHLTPVKIGLNFGLNVQIVSGLKENDKVITNPSDKTIEGLKVKVTGEFKPRKE